MARLSTIRTLATQTSPRFPVLLRTACRERLGCWSECVRLRQPPSGMLVSRRGPHNCDRPVVTSFDGLAWSQFGLAMVSFRSCCVASQRADFCAGRQTEQENWRRFHFTRTQCVPNFISVRIVPQEGGGQERKKKKEKKKKPLALGVLPPWASPPLLVSDEAGQGGGVLIHAGAPFVIVGVTHCATRSGEVASLIRAYPHCALQARPFLDDDVAFRPQMRWG